jgi:hypothetical protein
MKHIFIGLIALISANVISAQSKKPADFVKFNSESVDLGKAKLGNPVTATFTFTNTSKEDVIIETVTPGCGCTKSEYTKEPIKPGKTGTITATYNAAAVGTFSKKVYVKFMTIDAQQELTIIGIVEQ